MPKPVLSGGKNDPLKAGGRVFDIAPPGATPAPVTSRPVVTGTNPTVKDDISGISLPKSSSGSGADATSSRSPLRATNPEESYKRLMNGKSRVVIQPAGTFNKDVRQQPDPERSEPAKPSKLVEFDLSRLKGISLEAPVPSGDVNDLPKSKPVLLNRSQATARPVSPQSDDILPAAKRRGPMPAWLKEAEQQVADTSEAPTAVPTDLVVAEHKPAFRWGFLVIMILAAFVAIIVLICLVMIIIEITKH